MSSKTTRKRPGPIGIRTHAAEPVVKAAGPAVSTASRATNMEHWLDTIKPGNQIINNVKCALFQVCTNTRSSTSLI